MIPGQTFSFTSVRYFFGKYRNPGQGRLFLLPERIIPLLDSCCGGHFISLCIAIEDLDNHRDKGNTVSGVVLYGIPGSPRIPVKED